MFTDDDDPSLLTNVTRDSSSVSLFGLLHEHTYLYQRMLLFSLCIYLLWEYEQ